MKFASDSPGFSYAKLTLTTTAGRNLIFHLPVTLRETK
ncbi:hypothetical protein LEP1GSC005_2854 [Leptospira santarosai str. ST188]|nr:hypothetical protein LEP1GSC005_2854 [Leptospira santarosai str. ST188]